jgi:glutamate/tyrosine decarboxylase-like PLP-dependent enzyme
MARASMSEPVVPGSESVDRRSLLETTASRIADYRDRVDEMPVFPRFDAAALAARLGDLPDGPSPAAEVIRQLVDVIEPATVGSTGPRYFGFVIGGSLDSALAADMLTTGWDQNAYNAYTSPAAAIVEEVAGQWLKQLLGIPSSASFAFVTGGQGANTVGLASARHYVLAEVGWDVEQRGLIGAPPVRVVANGERHATVDRALRLLGLGAGSLEPVAAGPNGEIDVDDLARVLGSHAPGPTIVCLQAGSVNSGAIDDLAESISVARRQGAWVHVDGAFGLWAAASATYRHLLDGMESADSWGVDGHKWLNVPYDCGYAFVAHPAEHRAAMAYSAAYLTGQGEGGLRGPGDFVLESSRRARGFATWAALRELGRQGVEELVDRCCRLARLFAERLSALPGVTIVNAVTLNQVLVSFGSDDVTRRVIEAVQGSGECWMGGTTWRGNALMRISVSSWRTTDADVERSVAAIARAVATV